MSPTEKISDLPNVCRDPQHNPPSMVVWEPGIYRHTCPACGATQRFTVNRLEC